MQRSLWVGMLVIALALAGTPASGDPPEQIQERFYDKHGRLIAEVGTVGDLSFERHYYLAEAESEARPEGRGGDKGGGDKGGKGGKDPNAPATDCKSDAYNLAQWRWVTPYQATASSHAAIFNTAGETWDAATGADIFLSITPGSVARAGVQEFINQIDFVNLGNSPTVAVTTTWFYTSTGIAVESDARYNTFYAWSTSGAPNAMDVQAVGTHEIGHALGLEHPNGNPRHISCLTMYAYASEGATHERTLGDGDILGIRALYGP